MSGLEIGSRNTILSLDLLDYLRTRGKGVTCIHNAELDDAEISWIALKVSARDIIWTYHMIIPYPTTVQFSCGGSYTGGSALSFNNKVLCNPSTLGLTGVFDPTVTDEGSVYDSTKYGAAINRLNLAGASFGAGWFQLEPNSTFMQKVTSHADSNNVVTRFTFIEV